MRELLITKFKFSRYPVHLRIILSSATDKNYTINLDVQAYTEDQKSAKVFWELKADHVMIDDTWYPFIPGAKNEIEDILTSIGLNSTGNIKLKQYFQLIKSGSDLLIDVTGSIKDEISNYGEPDDKPTGVKADLYPYQLNGWRWLRFMQKENIGGILADEMGLGKTLQIIAVLSSEEKTIVVPSLIVAPTTLLENWRREFKKFVPQISTIIHHGPQRTGFPAELAEYDVVITSYDTVIRDSSLFSQIDWKMVVCDEAQAIKNPATKRSKAVKKIPRKAGFAVTGTPIENRLTDLWSIMDFSVPGFLGRQSEFEALYENQHDGASKLEILITPLILRRNVAEVAKDLPAKIIIPQVLELSPSEIEHYEQIREDTIKEFESNSSLVVLVRLRIFCTHPFLIEDKPGADPALHSNKYARLVEIAEEIVANSAKMLVFTSYNKMNDIIREDFAKRFGIYSNSIDGRTPTVDRQKIIDEFSSVKGAAVLVLNPIAAGAGLNITAANHVIHYNPEWNPAKEDQASARAYRRGQDRPVTIHRLLYANTVEEIIDDRLNRKRSLAGTAIVGVQGAEDDYDDIIKAIGKSPKER